MLKGKNVIQLSNLNYPLFNVYIILIMTYNLILFIKVKIVTHLSQFSLLF